MACHCASSTLRLFVRGIAEVDLPVSTRYRTPKRHAIAAALPTRSFGQRAFQSRSLSSTQAFSSGEIESEWHTKGRNEDTARPPSKAIVENAVMEITPETIDVLAAEAASSDAPASTRDGIHYVESSQKAAGDSKHTWKDDPAKRSAVSPKETIRRAAQIKTQGFSLYYSAPRQSSGPKYLGTMLEKQKDVPKQEAAQDDWVPPPRQPWMLHKAAMKEKFPDGYKPLKRLSPDAMAGIRALHAQMPDKFSTETLAQEFEVSPEAIRRIIKSKWRPNAEEETDRERRWFNRGEKVWTRYSELGLKPPKKWRAAGVPSPQWKREKYEYKMDELPELVTTSAAKDTRQRPHRAREVESEGFDMSDFESQIL